ncbi:MAG: hypothetical protein MUE67_09950 [Anaerolineales bacterium]|jgi:hypothetical protein|nr:hypothetical protein [Anaerolineales bacterium]
MHLKQRSAFIILSTLIAVLATIASAGGLLLEGLYRDNTFVTTTWLGNDAVTLFLAAPILVIAMVLAARGSLRAQLIWLGALDYMLYNYTFYLFGTAFNAFFLIYAVLVALSIFALIFGLVGLEVNTIRQRFSPRTPVKWIAGYLIFVAAGLGLIYVAQSVVFIATGQVPAIVAMTEHPTNVVFALDLTLLIPWLIVGAVWLMQRRPWGYVIAGILNVKGPLYTLVLAVNSILVAQAGISETSELPLWGTLTALGLITSGLFYVNFVKPTSNQSS